VAWFIGQSAIIIVLAFLLGLTVGWLVWARRVRALTVEVLAARIRAAGRYAYRPDRPPYRPDLPRRPRPGVWPGVRPVAGPPSAGGLPRWLTPRIPAPRVETVEIAGQPEGVGYDPDDDFDDDDFGYLVDFRPSADDSRGLARLRDLFGTTPPDGTCADAVPDAGSVDDPRAIGDITADSDVVDATDASTRAARVDHDRSDAAAKTNAANTNDANTNGATVDGTTDGAMANDAAPAGDALGIDDELALIEAVAAQPSVDDFTRVAGIGPKSAAALVDAGIRTYDQLATADVATVAAALRAARLRLAPNLGTWSTQARTLAGDAGWSRRNDIRRRLPRNDRPLMRHLPAADVNGVDHERRVERNDQPDRFGRDDQSQRRHRPGPVPQRRSVPPDTLDPDDLARIEGIGPAFAAALIAAGVRTFEQLAKADVATLRTAIGDARSSAVPSLSTWSAQARLLADGDEDGFAEMTARLIAGRDIHDNLQRIEGIGPQTCAALRLAGINTYQALANSDTARLRAAVQEAGIRFASSLTTWSRQARLLADGDEEGFADLARRLAGGSHRNGSDDRPR
jgi:predicted flap endonuclease-1-like 5' DNA nuclease